jgi:NAD(P)-dependent dehydrogenase (short-subunit alcohol dehydrogenase family)
MTEMTDSLAATPADIAWDQMRLPGLDGSSGCVVLGAAGAIGSRVVRALLAAGVPVLATARSAAVLARLAESVPAGDRKHLTARTADVTDEDALAAAFGQAASEFGRLRGVVNCAAVGDSGMLGAAPDTARARTVLDTNVVGTLLPAAAAYPYLKEHGPGASVVNMASIAAYRVQPAGVIYGASKAAVLRLTQQLAVEWGPAGVRVNCVSPGQTPTVIRGVDDPVGLAPRYKAHGPSRSADVPLRRYGTLDDFAGPALFLLSDLARYVNGQDILVDGGIGWRKFSTA